MQRRLRDHRCLTHLSRLRLLHAVQRIPGRRLKAIADEASLHVNTARDHLRALEVEGLIRSTSVSSGGPGRPAIVFFPARPTEAEIRHLPVERADASDTPAVPMRAEEYMQAARMQDEEIRRSA